MTKGSASLYYYHKQALRERVVAMVVFALVVQKIQAGLFGSGGCTMWPYSIGEDGGELTQTKAV